MAIKAFVYLIAYAAAFVYAVVDAFCEDNDGPKKVKARLGRAAV